MYNPDDEDCDYESFKPKAEIEIPRIVRSNEQFGRRLYKIMSDKNLKNFVISPFSTHCVLCMLYAGADGRTSEALQSSLILSDSTTTAEEYYGFLTKASNIKAVSFNTANKIFVMENRTVRADYRALLKRKYSSDTQSLNFLYSERSAKQINNWVEKQTNSKITNLVKPSMFDTLTRLVLVNGVHFKGNWLQKFTDASKRKFYLIDGTYKHVDIMNVKGYFHYNNDHNIDAQIIELPYVGKEISMYVFLPNDNKGIKDLEKDILSYDFLKCNKGMRNQEVDVFLPKFKIEFEMSLKPLLEKMGMSIIFSDRARFTKMTCHCGDFKVSEFVQKAFIEVDEEGTEAAAATAAAMSLRSMHKEQVFMANHPFMFTLNFNSINNTPFFFGRFMEP